MAQISGLAFNSFFFGVTPTTGAYNATAFGEIHTVPAATVLTTNADTPSGNILPFAATTGIYKGQKVTGTHIPSDTVVATTTGTSVTLSNAVSGDVANGASITFHPFVLVANATSLLRDFGVVYAATGLPLANAGSGDAPAAGQYALGTGGNNVYCFDNNDTGATVLVSYSYTVATQGQIIPVTNQLVGTTPTFAAKLFTNFQGKEVSAYLYNCAASKLSFGTKLEDYVLPEMSFSVAANGAGNVLDWNFAEAS